jgi:hypothetical protein
MILISLRIHYDYDAYQNFIIIAMNYDVYQNLIIIAMNFDVYQNLLQLLESQVITMFIEILVIILTIVRIPRNYNACQNVS